MGRAFFECLGIPRKNARLCFKIQSPVGMQETFEKPSSKESSSPSNENPLATQLFPKGLRLLQNLVKFSGEDIRHHGATPLKNITIRTHAEERRAHLKPTHSLHLPGRTVWVWFGVAFIPSKLRPSQHRGCNP